MKLNLEIICPYGDFYNGQVDRLDIRTALGNMGVMAGHIPLVGVVEISHLVIHEGSKKIKAAIHGGVIYIEKDKTLVIANSIEEFGKIDLERAKQSKERAEKLLQIRHEDTDFARAELSLKRAINRLESSR